MFLVTDLTSYAKMISLDFFHFCHNILYWFYVNGEIVNKGD